MTIWKYPIHATDEQVVTMPDGARILTVQAQAEKPCLWAMVDPAARRVEARKIYTYGTGHPIEKDPETLNYIGTYQLVESGLVFHVFTDKRR